MPDVQRKGFNEECKRQALLVKQDEMDQEINAFILDAAEQGMNRGDIL